MSIFFLHAQGATLGRHRLQFSDEGAACADRSTELADGILALFGLASKRRCFGVEPAIEGAETAGVLAEVVTLVADGLGLSVEHSPAIAVRPRSEGVFVDPIEFDGPDKAYLEVGEAGVMLHDLRAGEGEPSIAERVREHVPGVRVLGVETVEHVVTAALGGNQWRHARTSDAAQAQRSADALFKVVLRSKSNPVSWLGLAEIATGRLLSVPLESLDAFVRWKLAFTRDVAWRHAGESVMPEWPEDALWEQLAGAERLAVAAHLVQGAADAAHEVVPAAVDLARETLEADGQASHERAAELWGALGRAHASVGQLGAAIRCLRHACDTWRGLGREEQLSFAVSEMLRVSALVCGEAQSAAEACIAHRATDDMSRAYVRLSQARAEVLLGALDHALELLNPDDARWPARHEEVVLASLRWRHRALLTASRDESAESCMKELEVRGETDQLHLARLDRALARDGDWRGPLSDLFESIPMGEEALRTWRTVGGRGKESWTREQAVRFADWYRY